MGLAVFTLVCGVLVPWAVGAYIITKFSHQEGIDKDKVKDMWSTPTAFWVVALPLLTVPPFFIWQSRDEGSSAYALEFVVKESFSRSWDTTIHVLKYIVPFALYPMILFWLKFLVNSRAQAEEQNNEVFAGMNKHDPVAHSQQAKLIGFVIKLLIMIFVFFAALDKIGVSTGEVLEITTVFSLGLSWSMRDWLSSLWAAFMIAMTTDLTSGSYIRLSNMQEDEKAVQVVRTGLMYTVCIKYTKPKEMEYIYIANSSLLNNGFSVVKSVQ